MKKDRTNKNLQLLQLIVSAGQASNKVDAEYPQKQEMYWMSQREHLCNFVLARLKNPGLIVKNERINGALLRQKGAKEWLENNIDFKQLEIDWEVRFNFQQIFDILIFLIHYLSIQQNLITDADRRLVREMMTNFRKLVERPDCKAVKFDREKWKCIENLVSTFKEYFWEKSELEISREIVDFFNELLSSDSDLTRKIESVQEQS